MSPEELNEAAKSREFNTWMLPIILKADDASGLPFSEEQFKKIRANILSSLRDIHAKSKKQVEVADGIYQSQKETNEEYPILSSAAQSLGGLFGGNLEQKYAELAYPERRKKALENLDKLDQLLKDDRLAEAMILVREVLVESGASASLVTTIVDSHIANHHYFVR